MRKLIILSIALQLCVAGLFANSAFEIKLNLSRHLSSGLPTDSIATQHGSLKILSWNIQMLPKIAGDLGQGFRAKAIGEVLKNSDYDIIVFQESFTKNTRESIWEIVKVSYPYESGKPLGGGITLINSGVWIISKLPIKVRIDKLFRECDGMDCFSKKGATLIEVDKDGHTFQVIGTHLQADEGKDKQKARDAQYYELAKLLDVNTKEGVPQIIAGDFNTRYTDSIKYLGMLGVLKAEDGLLSGNLKYSWDNTINDFTKNNKDTSQVLLDYIFLRPNGYDFASEIRVIRRLQYYWACTNSDLSDHFAVEAKFEY